MNILQHILSSYGEKIEANFNRTMSNMTYYANLLSTNTLSGDRFVNAGLGVVVDMFAITIAWYMAQYADRRKIFMISSAVTAFGIGVAPFISICK